MSEAPKGPDYYAGFEDEPRRVDAGENNETPVDTEIQATTEEVLKKIREREEADWNPGNNYE